MLQPVTEPNILYFYCRGMRDEPVPVYLQPQGAPPELLLPSIGALVRLWINVLQSGYVSVTPAGAWHYDETRALPDEQMIGFW